MSKRCASDRDDKDSEPVKVSLAESFLKGFVEFWTIWLKY